MVCLPCGKRFRLVEDYGFFTYSVEIYEPVTEPPKVIEQRQYPVPAYVQNAITAALKKGREMAGR